MGIFTETIINADDARCEATMNYHEDTDKLEYLSVEAINDRGPQGADFTAVFWLAVDQPTPIGPIFVTAEAGQTEPLDLTEEHSFDARCEVSYGTLGYR